MKNQINLKIDDLKVSNNISKKRFCGVSKTNKKSTQHRDDQNEKNIEIKYILI